jgi:mRNA-degrading endonuclease RelE of RelBE toxin-antitoxin system
MFDVLFAPRVVDEDLPHLPPHVLDDLLGEPDDPESRGKVELLRTNPEIGAHLGKQLHGFQRLALTGRYRCIYKVFGERRIVGVVLVGIRRGVHRSDVYQRAKSMIARLSDPTVFEKKTDRGSQPGERQRATPRPRRPQNE